MQNGRKLCSDKRTSVHFEEVTTADGFELEIYMGLTQFAAVMANIMKE